MSGNKLLTSQAFRLLHSSRNTDSTPAVRLARALHTTPPRTPAAVRAHLKDVPYALPRLARYAQAGDPHALLVAAVLMRDQLRAIAIHVGGGDDATEDTLAAFFTLLRTAAEPDTLTERPPIAAHVLRCLYATASGPQEAVPLDPHTPVFRPAAAC